MSRNKRLLLIVAVLALFAFTPALAAQEPLISRVCLITDVGKVDDGTFNQFAYEGMERVAEDYGLETTYIETVNQADYSNNMQTCIDSGFEVIISVGFLMTDATLEKAQENPDVYFIGVDQFYEDPPPNLIGVQYREDQSGFLAGALAALMSETGKIGGVYGIPVPAVVKFRNGFEQGARYINPDIDVQGVYIDSFTDPARGAETADQLIADDRDVIFGAGGQTGSGAIKRAAEEGVYVIGVDQDEYFTTFGGGTTPGAEFLISSAMKRVDQGVYLPIESLVNGDDSDFGTIRTLSALNDGITFAPAHDSDVPEEVTAQVQKIFEMLKDGSLTTGVDPLSGELLPSIFDAAGTLDLNGDGDLDFETLAAALEAAGDLGLTASAYTFFAPTDEAFEALPEGTLDSLLADPEGALAPILKYHIVEKATPAEVVVTLDGQEVATVNGAPITISVTEKGVVLNDSVNVTITDVYVAEGVVHVIDAVLMPPEM